MPTRQGTPGEENIVQREHKVESEDWKAPVPEIRYEREETVRVLGGVREMKEAAQEIRFHGEVKGMPQVESRPIQAIGTTNLNIPPKSKAPVYTH